jgi:hypothetical protein
MVRHFSKETSMALTIDSGGSSDCDRARIPMQIGQLPSRDGHLHRIMFIFGATTS